MLNRDAEIINIEELYNGFGWHTLFLLPEIRNLTIKIHAKIIKYELNECAPSQRKYIPELQIKLY